MKRSRLKPLSVSSFWWINRPQNSNFPVETFKIILWHMGMTEVYEGKIGKLNSIDSRMYFISCCQFEYVYKCCIVLNPLFDIWNSGFIGLWINEAN